MEKTVDGAKKSFIVLHLLFEANFFHNYKALIKIELIIRCKTGMTPVSFKPTTNLTTRLLLANGESRKSMRPRSNDPFT